MLRCNLFNLNVISDACFAQQLYDLEGILELEGVSKYNYSRDRWRFAYPNDHMKLLHPIPEFGE